MNNHCRAFIIACIGILFFSDTRAQSVVIWYENFSNSPCTTGCSANGYNGNGGSWTETALGNTGNGTASNKWYVSCAENGNALGACGSGCAGNNTLHVANVKGSPNASIICPTGDCGAIYDFGGTQPTTTTRKRAESPAINCTDFINMTVSFSYMTTGYNNFDKFVLYCFDGTSWDSITTPAKTSSGKCSSPHYGTWTKFSIALPASANKQSGVKIGFVWQNNNDGLGSNPSIAIDSIQLTGTFILPPIANYSPSQNNFCQNTCINFADNSTNYPSSWSWNFGGGATPNTSTDENPSNVCFNMPGNYFVVLTATNANGSDTAGMTIVVNPCTKPKAGFTIQQAQPFCYGDCDTLMNTSQNATSYSWDFGGAATPNTSTAESPVICFDKNGTFHILLTASNTNGTDTFGMNVTTQECLAPAFDVTAITTCTGECVSFTDQSTGNATEWKWGFQGGSPAISTQQNPANVCYDNAGTYSVKLKISNGGGSDSLVKTKYITVLLSPLVAVSNDTSIKYGDSAKLVASGGVSYIWSPTSGLKDSDNAVTVAAPTITTTYTVTITGANSCIIQRQVVITVIQPQLIFLPNTFTPNGDGKNDIFKFYTSEPIVSSELRIFDRWGELIFDSTNPTVGWDGTYKGKPMEVGVYVYWYDVTLIGGKNLKGKGDVTLLR